MYSDDIPAGACGSWRTGVMDTWCARSLNTLTIAQRLQYHTRLEQMRLQRIAEIKQRQQKTSLLATRQWNDATSADPSHPYLSRKGIQPHHLRQFGSVLLVPMIDIQGSLWNLQRIYPNGDKRFLSGGRVKGCFALLGDLEAGLVYVCEGLATGATIFEQSGIPTLCAMNASNLMTVCMSLSNSDTEIIICADNDHYTDGNPGLAKAREAAVAIGASVTWPDQCGIDCHCTDFNDLSLCHTQGVEL